MADEEIDAIMEHLHSRLEHGIDELADATVEKVRMLISIPVERTATSVIRSKPGEPPRRDSGDLYNSIRKGPLVSDADGVRTEAGSDLWYSVNLENGAGRVDPRPHWRPAYEEIAPNAAEFVAREMKG